MFSLDTGHPSLCHIAEQLLMSGIILNRHVLWAAVETKHLK